MGDLPDDWPASTYAQYHGDEFGLYSQRVHYHFAAVTRVLHRKVGLF
jgi:hypothetical protein